MYNNWQRYVALGDLSSCIVDTNAAQRNHRF